MKDMNAKEFRESKSDSMMMVGGNTGEEKIEWIMEAYHKHKIRWRDPETSPIQERILVNTGTQVVIAKKRLSSPWYHYPEGSSIYVWIESIVGWQPLPKD